MKLTNLIQGTKEWLEWRKTGITSTDVAIINGTNTFRGNSPLKLWQKKLDIGDEEPVTHIMREGNLLEPEALAWFNKKYSTNFIKPCGGYHEKYDWTRISLDGYDPNSKYILETKGGASTYDKATKGIVPPYYLDQAQYNIFGSGKQYCYYLAYRPDQEPVVIVIERDQEYIAQLKEKGKEFYEYLTKMIPPPLAEKEFVEIKGDKATQLALKWKETKEKLKISQETEKMAREALLDQTDGGNCLFPDAAVKVELRTKKGSINYDAIFKDHDIDKQKLEKYRKPEASWLQPSIVKQS